MGKRVCFSTKTSTYRTGNDPDLAGRKFQHLRQCTMNIMGSLGRGPEGHPRLLWEVEVKYSWKTDEWPDSWKELRIPYRKQRLLDKWKNECYNDILTFVVFNHDCTKAWHVDGHTLLDCEVKEVSNRNIRKGEKFFHIPVTDAYLVDMKNESSGGH